MSLTNNDLDQIRLIIRDESRSFILHELEPITTDRHDIFSKLEALENDIKDIDRMISSLIKDHIKSDDFKKLTIKEKLTLRNAYYLLK